MNKNKIVEVKACNNVIKERSILEALNHPFLANLKYSFQDEKYLYMCTEVMLGGDLRFFLSQFDNAEEEVVRFWTSQMILAINYVHSKGFIHR
jgi:serine/threonine kinase 32